MIRHLLEQRIGEHTNANHASTNVPYERYNFLKNLHALD